MAPAKMHELRLMALFSRMCAARFPDDKILAEMAEDAERRVRIANLEEELFGDEPQPASRGARLP